VRSSVATTCVRVVPGEAFKRCCLASGKMDGSARNSFFPRIETGSESAPSFRVLGGRRMKVYTGALPDGALSAGSV